MLDPEQCYRAVQSRDQRFDGWFVTGVTSTGIYCRPSCPAITPKRGNVEFHPTAAAAQQRGFRACKRCRPDATPGSPEWDVRSDVVGRAMRLIADGEVERAGVGGLAARLGYSDRQLRRVMVDDVGAAPLALARAQRAQTARLLIETTDLPITDIAFAAGFASIRQFNDTIREVFAVAPRQLRRSAANVVAPVGAISPPGSLLRLRLPARTPFDGPATLAFLGARVIDGIETWDGTTYARSLRLPGGPATVVIRPGDDHVHIELRLSHLSDVQPAVQRIRRLLDLDADPLAVEAALGADRRLRPAVQRYSGWRAPGAVDPAEMVTRAVIGQQITVAGARRIAARLVDIAGEPFDSGIEGITAVFPCESALAGLGDVSIGVPRSRLATLRTVCAALADGELHLDAGADWHEARRALLAFRGIGPWTADYLAMRALGNPDVWLSGDVGVRRGCAALGIDDAERASHGWRPWRTYATHLMWRT